MANSIGLVEQARILIRSAAYHPAEAVLQSALKLAPNDPDAHALLGLVYCYTGREDKAITCLGQAECAQDYGLLSQILADYIYCRCQLARTRKYSVDWALGIGDSLGEPSLNTGISISACLIVRDEERNLHRCLRSLVGHVDEIIVVDTGSTDATVSIAESYGAKTKRVRWEDDFSAARNVSLEMATGHWILWIDADEEITPESWPSIDEGIIRPHFGGYYFTVINHIGDGASGEQFVHSPVRLFRKVPGVRFSGRIHEQVMPSIAAAGLSFAHMSDARIIHYGYQTKQMAIKNKLERTVRMLEREVRDYPEDAFNWFNLANAYAVGERHSDVIRSGKICLRLLEPNDAYGSLTYHLIMASLIATKRSEDALALAVNARSKGFGDILVEFEYATALYVLGKFDEALKSIDCCMHMPWPPGTSGDYGIVTYKSHALKGKILLAMGQIEEAYELFDFALSVDPKFVPAILGKGAALERLGHAEDALLLYCQSSHPAVIKAKGHLLTQCGETTKAAEAFESIWRQNPNDHEAWIHWTKASEELGDVQSVVNAYNAYAETKEFDADMLVGWGRALEAAGQYERAMHCYSEAIKRDPNLGNAYFNGGDLLYRLGQYADAAHIYEKGLRTEPAYAQGWFALGNALAQLGLLEGAASSYRQALIINPDHEDATHNLEVVTEADQFAA
jgi:tetratricopeptide (TPR) repeat protein